MADKPPQYLIVPARYSTPPEFRAAHNKFGRAYSGPEQRQRLPHHITTQLLLRQTVGRDTERPGVLFAA